MSWRDDDHSDMENEGPENGPFVGYEEDGDMVQNQSEEEQDESSSDEREGDTLRVGGFLLNGDTHGSALSLDFADARTSRPLSIRGHPVVDISQVKVGYDVALRPPPSSADRFWLAQILSLRQQSPQVRIAYYKHMTFRSRTIIDIPLAP